MFVSSLLEFPENCVYKHDEPNYFIEYLQRKLLAANFLSYDIESDRQNAFIRFAYFNNTCMSCSIATYLILANIY
jgi:hypothetical protein